LAVSQFAAEGMEKEKGKKKSVTLQILAPRSAYIFLERIKGGKGRGRKGGGNLDLQFSMLFTLTYSFILA